jgi:lysozyme
LELLKQKEGFKTTPYKDSAGKWTVGYGHLIVQGDGVSKTEDISDEKATSLLEKDCQIAVDCVNDAVTSNINQNQFDALVLFCYNVGVSAFRNSTLLKDVNGGRLDAASDQFMLWTKIHTPQGMFVEIAGLRNRRQAEKDLFNTPFIEGEDNSLA